MVKLGRGTFKIINFKTNSKLSTIGPDGNPIYLQVCGQMLATLHVVNLNNLGHIHPFCNNVSMVVQNP